MNKQLQSSTSSASRTIAIARELPCAVTRDEFFIEYQPIFKIVDGKQTLRGAEALLRWKHPSLGLVMPDEFIALAEHSSHIQRIGTWVIERACRQLRRWSASSIDLSISVNISPNQFLLDPGFARCVIELVTAYQVKPGCLKFEVTESTLLKDRDLRDVIGSMHILIAAGITFSLDDFGTGYSSLHCLSKLPLAELKLDRRFIQDIEQRRNQAIPRMIIGCAQSMGLSLVAEGIETQYQKDILLRMGCTNFQGYYFGRPAPIDEFMQVYLGQSVEYANDGYLETSFACDC